MCVAWKEGDDYAEGYATRQAYQGGFHVAILDSNLDLLRRIDTPRRLGGTESRRRCHCIIRRRTGRTGGRREEGGVYII